MDFQDSLIPRRFVLDLFNLDESVDYLVDQIDKVTVDDIKYVASFNETNNNIYIKWGFEL